MSLKNTKKNEAAETKNPPVAKVRVGLITASIWENKTDKGTFHNVTFERRYKDGDQWKSSHSYNTGDLLDILGFIGDLGSGTFYFMARIFDWGGTSITSAVADYGTKFIVVAGLLNIMAAVDAYHIAIGKKQ